LLQESLKKDPCGTFPESINLLGLSYLLPAFGGIGTGQARPQKATAWPTPHRLQQARVQLVVYAAFARHKIAYTTTERGLAASQVGGLV